MFGYDIDIVLWNELHVYELPLTNRYMLYTLIFDVTISKSNQKGTIQYYDWNFCLLKIKRGYRENVLS